MKSLPSRRSRGGSRGHTMKPAEHSVARSHRRTAARDGPAANAVPERQRAVVVREASQEALRAREASVQTHTEVERLLGQLREANERLIVAAVHAQNVSDDANAEAAQARTDLAHLMDATREANERLVAASAHMRILEEQARQGEEDYRRLSSRLLQLQDEERRRLALDLHDSTAQHLAALTMNLDLVKGPRNALDARSRKALAESRSLAEQCSREVRTLAYLLHPPLLDEMGLLSALRWYVAGFTERSGVHVALELGEIDRLSGPVETALFRIVQESLSNIHRHAHSPTALIRLASTTDAVLLDVQDQGRGLRDDLKQRDGTLVPGALGVGIQGMRERIRQFGGSFDVEFTHTGTTVRVRVPLNEDAS